MTRDTWPRPFTATVRGYAVRELIIGRDTPLGLGRPRCAWCGRMIPRPPHAHHLLFRGRLGDGRPSNGISLCPADPDCHEGAEGVHGQPSLAAARGFARSQHAPKPDVYAQPVHCAWRGWIVLDDDGGFRPATPAELERWFGADARPGAAP